MGAMGAMGTMGTMGVMGYMADMTAEAGERKQVSSVLYDLWRRTEAPRQLGAEGMGLIHPSSGSSHAAG